MSEMKSDLEDNTRSRVLAADWVILVGCLTTCVNEKTEQKSKNSFAREETGCIRGGSLFHVMFGMLKSPSKNKGNVGKRDETMFVAS